MAKVYLDAAQTVGESFFRKEGQPKDLKAEKTRVVTLTQDFMGLNLGGDRFEIIDQPNRTIVWSTIKDWVIEGLERRYEFLCKLDFAIVRMEMTYQRLEQDEENEAKRKARNRKKSEAKKALKQKRKALKAEGADEVRAEGDDQVQSANDTEEKVGAQVSKEFQGSRDLPKISILFRIRDLPLPLDYSSDIP